MAKLTLAKIKELTATFKNASTVYYDELEDVAHSFKPNEIIIGTSEIDNSTYYIKYNDEQFEVSKKKSLNPRNHNNPNFTSSPMTEDDYSELERLWEGMYVHCMAVQKLLQTDTKSEWNRLIDLFSNIGMPCKPKSSPSKTNRIALLRDINKLFIQLNLIVEFEWKEWSEDGVIKLNSFFKSTGFNIQLPTDVEKNCVAESDDFAQSIINWTQSKLNSVGKTIYAIEPLDEFQTFLIIPTEIAPRVLEILNTFTVRTISSKP